MSVKEGFEVLIFIKKGKGEGELNSRKELKPFTQELACICTSSCLPHIIGSVYVCKHWLL